ncbi:transglycosylase domain-containing protein [Planktomarina temperata]|nr:transglycosylase domain-containing protein [Planktomarina temperata]
MRLGQPDELQNFIWQLGQNIPDGCGIGLVAGLGGILGSKSIVNFTNVLKDKWLGIGRREPLDIAVFVTKPFKFEGAKRGRTTDQALDDLQKMLPKESIYVNDLQDLMSSMGDKQFDEAFSRINDMVSNQISAHFSIAQKSTGNLPRASETIKSEPQNKGFKIIADADQLNGSRKRNGQATYTYHNGDKYVGEWKDGKLNGQGTYTHHNGDKYVGEWKDGKSNGQATYTYHNGDQYIGEYKDDKKNGQGTYTHASGAKYVGEWTNGKQNGRGTYAYDNGDQYIGQWKDGKPNGQGTRTYADGRIESGIWRDNVLEAGKLVKVAPKGDTSTKSKVPSHVLPDFTQDAEETPNERSVVKEKQKLLPKFIKSVFKLSAYAIFIFAVMLGGFIALNGYQLDDQRLHAAITQPSALVKIGSEGLVLDEAVKCNCERTLKPSELPETFKQALIAIEDKRFYQHIGFDIVSVGRAILSFGTRGGGSTIEMQLVKNSIAQPKNDIIRKISELIFAYRINHIFEKDDIVRLYASRVNFGNIGATRINGLRSAAGYYFGKKPENITIEEAAILVAILKNPNAYDPIKKRANNLKRAKAVLTLLVANGQAGERSIENIEKYMPKRGNVKPYRDRYTEDLIKKEIEKLQLAAGKYRFILSIDPIAQMQALNVLDKAVRSERSRGVERASLVSLDKNGAIKAIIGGQDYLKNSYNLATQAERQAASTMKIVTYLSALEQGYNKDTKVFDDPSKIKRFKARNSNRKYAGETTLDNCFAKSKNVCTYYIAEQLTRFEHLSEMSYRLHLTSKETKGDSIVLGAAETTLLKNTAAFASIKNLGFYKEPYLIRFVLGEYGGLVYEHSAGREYVFSEEVAVKMTELLDKVVSPDGTANNALIPGHRTFGKTGTSQNNRDAWFVGFSEHGITTGVWVGPSDDGFMRGISGGNVPSQIFKKFNQNLYERYEFCGPNFMMQSSGYGRDINC